MWNIQAASAMVGVSVRTLQYYDKIGLLPPAAYTDSGYRQYDRDSLDRLQQILLLRQLGFSLKEIQALLDRPAPERQQILEQQLELLREKRDQLEGRMALLRGFIETGGTPMKDPISRKQQDQYDRQAQAQWGHTGAWQHYEAKRQGRSPETEDALGRGLMSIFRQLGQLRTLPAESEPVQDLVRKLRHYIATNYYPCPPELFRALGRMYADGEAFTQNIDRAAGPGTAEFVSRSIEIYINQTL